MQQDLLQKTDEVMHSLKKKLLYYILFNCWIASIYAQIPNGGFENWTSCVHPMTYPVSPSNEKSVLNNYMDSLVSGNFKLYYPAFISPNGDGGIDVFLIEGIGLSDYQIQIFNRNGSIVYTGQAGASAWDGRNSGSEIAPEGTYFYAIKVKVGCIDRLN